VTEPGDGRSERWVYFIQAGEAGPIKIGSAGEPEEALRKHQTSNAEELVLLGFCAGGFSREFALHAELVEHRQRGEWYRPTPEVLAAIARCLEPDDDWDSVDAWERRAVEALTVARAEQPVTAAAVVVDEVKPLRPSGSLRATCAARGCYRAISWKQAWCHRHWKQVPEEERAARTAAVFAARSAAGSDEQR
jgi:hypothetical protein